MCRLVKDCSKTSGLQAQAMDSLQEKIKTLQSSVDHEKATFVQAKVLKIRGCFMGMCFCLNHGWVIKTPCKGIYETRAVRMALLLVWFSSVVAVLYCVEFTVCFYQYSFSTVTMYIACIWL